MMDSPHKPKQRGARLLLTAMAALLLPLPLFASIGVGVGTGKIQLDERLKPGGTYQLPIFSVLNTGDEPGEYEVSIEYHEKQPQLKPSREWFAFTPPTFRLEPGKVQAVQVALTLPIKTEPGDYFAYVEAHPAKKADDGQSRVGIAAASKLYFTVQPANVFQGIYYRASSFMARNAPWTYVVLAVIAVGVLISILRRFVSFNISLQRKPPQQ